MCACVRCVDLSAEAAALFRLLLNDAVYDRFRVKNDGCDTRGGRIQAKVLHYLDTQNKKQKSWFILYKQRTPAHFSCGRGCKEGEGCWVPLTFRADRSLMTLYSRTCEATCRFTRSVHAPTRPRLIHTSPTHAVPPQPRHTKTNLQKRKRSCSHRLDVALERLLGRLLRVHLAAARVPTIRHCCFTRKPSAWRNE
jgi:hypothetical protein